MSNVGDMLNRLQAKVQELESRMTSERVRSDKEISMLKEKVAMLSVSNQHQNSDDGVVTNHLQKMEIVDPLCRRVEWTITEVSKKILEIPKGQSIWSPEFSAGGMTRLQLEFFPNGRETANIDGCCSLFFFSKDTAHVKYQLFVGQSIHAPDEDDFKQGEGRGHSNFCFLPAEIEQATDSVIVGVEIIDVQKCYSVGPSIKIFRSSLGEIVSRELSVVENRSVTHVEWHIRNISRKLKIFPKGSAIYSPVFSAAGVKEILLEFYPNGNPSTSKEHCCAYYIRCPEGAHLVMSLFVGDYKRGPITAKFDSDAGKGLPDFCDIRDQILKDVDTLVVGIEIKNVASPSEDGGEKKLLTLLTS